MSETSELLKPEEDYSLERVVDEKGQFTTIENFVDFNTSTKGELKGIVQERNFIYRLVPEELKQWDRENSKVTKSEIVKAMVGSGLVTNPDGWWGRYQVQRNLKRTHKTSYWRGYTFVELGYQDGETIYKVNLEDISGLGPGY